MFDTSVEPYGWKRGRLFARDKKGREVVLGRMKNAVVKSKRLDAAVIRLRKPQLKSSHIFISPALTQRIHAVFPGKRDGKYRRLELSENVRIWQTGSTQDSIFAVTNSSHKQHGKVKRIESQHLCPGGWKVVPDPEDPEKTVEVCPEGKKWVGIKYVAGAKVCGGDSGGIVVRKHSLNLIGLVSSAPDGFVKVKGPDGSMTTDLPRKGGGKGWCTKSIGITGIGMILNRHPKFVVHTG